MPTSHTLGSIVTVDQSTPLILVLLYCMLIALLQTFCGKRLIEWGFGFEEVKVTPDENNP